MIKKLKNALLSYDYEEKKILTYLNKYSHGGKILDVGCGYGRILKFLKANGVNAYGIDVNPEIVKSCCVDGLNVKSVDDFVFSHGDWDTILMIHVIEHMDSEKCFKFIDQYLDLLKPGGILIIATPLLTDYFYEDFDHVKPYLPVGIQMVFGSKAAQVQYRARNKINLIDIWYKRYFFRVVNNKFLFFSGNKKITSLLTVIFALIFKLSFGLLGKKDGWVGVFEKAK